MNLTSVPAITFCPATSATKSFEAASTNVKTYSATVKSFEAKVKVTDLPSAFNTAVPTVGELVLSESLTTSKCLAFTSDNFSLNSTTNEFVPLTVILVTSGAKKSNANS